MCFEHITQYAPPYALRVITVSFGTVASLNAYSSFAPCRMIPPYSCAVPGRKPGTSTNVTSGMLKASQKRTKRAALTEALMSSAPAITFGWLATTPTGCPSRRAKPTTMFIAKYCWTSKKSPLSTTIRTTSLMSYDSFDESGMIVARPGSARSGSSVGGKRGGCWSQLCGTKLSRRRTWAKHSSSDSARKCPTPDGRGVVAAKHDIPAADLGQASNHAAGWGPPAVQPEARRPLGGDDVELLERVAVDHPGDELARRQLVLGVLALESLRVAVA